MEQLLNFSKAKNLTLKKHCKLFHNKFKYRLTINLQIPPDNSISRHCTQHSYNFIAKLRANVSGQQGRNNIDAIRIEDKVAHYYFGTLELLDKVLNFLEENKNTNYIRYPITMNNMILTYSSSDAKNVEYRKRLPHKKFKYKITMNRCSGEEIKKIINFFKNNNEEMRLMATFENHDDMGYRGTYGTWPGDELGYVTTKKMLMLVEMSFGEKIKHITEYRLENG
jgi:hypothetical protein